MFRTAKITATLTVGAAAVALLAGCSAGSVSASAGHSVAPSSSGTAAAAQTPAPTKTTATNPVFGQTVTYKGGLGAKAGTLVDVSVSKGVDFQPSEYASGGTLPHNVKFTFTLTNKGTANYDPTLFNTTMNSGGQEANAVFDTDQNLGSSPQTTILPGKTVTWSEGYNVASSTDIQMDVNPGFEFDTTTWTY